MRLLLSLMLLVFGAGMTWSDELPPHVTIPDLLVASAKRPPVRLNLVKDEEFARRLKTFPSADGMPTGSVTGVDATVDPIVLRTSIKRPKKFAIAKLKNGSASVDQDGNEILALHVRATIGSLVRLAIQNQAGHEFRIFDSDFKEVSSGPAQFRETPGVFADAVKGDDFYIVAKSVRPRRLAKTIRLATVVRMQWPAIANEVVEAAGQVLDSSPERDRVGSSPYGFHLPDDLRDYACVRSDPLFAQFPPTAFDLAKSSGLFESLRWSNEGRPILSMCDGTLVNGAAKKGIATVDVCIGKVQSGRKFGADLIAASMYWDYENESCAAGPPLRWELQKIQANGRSHLEAVIYDADGIVVYQVPDPGSRPSVEIGLHDPTTVLWLKLHHADLRPLQASFQLHAGEFDPSTTPTPAVAPCSEASGNTHVYATQYIGTSGAAAGPSGATLIGGEGRGVALQRGICRAGYQGNTTDFTVDVLARDLKAFLDQPAH